jgi:hypothetical protein
MGQETRSGAGRSLTGMAYKPDDAVLTMDYQSTVTCPYCGTAKSETMPANACQFLYRCTGCGGMLKPKPGDCCVFCSYGSVPCPPVQLVRPGTPDRCRR